MNMEWLAVLVATEAFEGSETKRAPRASRPDPTKNLPVAMAELGAREQRRFGANWMARKTPRP